MKLIADSNELRIKNAKQFLKENPSESMIAAARIFNVAYTTLKNSIYRDRCSESVEKRGESNKILQQHQVEAIHKFIRFLLLHCVLPTHGLIFAAIRKLKQAQDPEFEGPSQR